MEHVVEDLTRGNVTEVKVIIASVALGLAVYQLVLIAVAYGRLRLSFLEPRPAGWTHRASGDAILVLLLVVAAMCVSYFEVEDGRALVHAVAAIALLAVLALKVAVLRRFHGLSHLLPALGISVFALLALTWATSAGDFLESGP